MSKDNKYVVVNALTQYRMRYVIPLDELQNLNPDVPVDPKWALDCVTCEDVEEFSQLWLGETIIDHEVVNEERIVEMFDTDHEYLTSMDTERKIELIRNWRSKLKAEENKSS